MNELFTISGLRLAYDHYCDKGIGSADLILREAMSLLEAANAKIADERRCNAELRIELNRLRKAVLDTLEPPPIYHTDSIAPTLNEILRDVHLRQP